MFNTNVVLLGTEVDCDGSSDYAYRIVVPLERAMTMTAREVCDHAIATGQMTSYCRDGIHTKMTIQQFLVEFRGFFEDSEDREVFLGARPLWDGTFFNYMTLDRSFRPWAGPDGDDSIGIPALDTTYDDEIPVY